jgi:tRNA(fMet)-specific endonuclease VapC
MTNRFVLDTDVLTFYQQGHAAVVRNVQARPLDRLAVTVVSVEQQLTGCYTKLRRAKTPDQLARAYKRMTDAIRFLVRFEIVTFSEPAILRYDALRAAHRRLDKSDLRIAAIVL